MRLGVEDTDIDAAEAQGSSSGATAPLLVDTDVSLKKFRFNPPLHRFVIPPRVDLGSPTPWTRQADPNTTNWNWVEAGEWGENFNNLRLGRMIQGKFSAGMAAVNDYRYGFRFLYNPSSITVQATRNKSFVLDPRSTANAVLSGIDQNFQTIQMQLFLNRAPDVLLPSVSASDYSPNATAEDIQNLRRYGTKWDLEILYRMCNGIWELSDRGKTGNIGVIIPSNARLIFGRGQNYFGFVESLRITHQRFSADMVPIHTIVNLNFRRHVDMSPGETADWMSALGGIASTPEEDGGGAADDATGEYEILGNNQDAPVPGYNYVTSGFFANRGSRIHGAWDYGKGGVNGQPVHATQEGTVVHAGSGGWGSSYGNHVILWWKRVHHLYAHMSVVSSALRPGMKVKAGTYLGRVGSTGDSTGPHLHYEEQQDGAIDTGWSHARRRRPLWANRTPGDEAG